MFNPSVDLYPTPNSSRHAPVRMLNDVDLCVWVADAQPGEQIVYYAGHLSRDRLPHRDGYADIIRRKINELGNAAWMLGDENWVHLVQRRVSYGCWEYIAVRKAEAPKLKPVYRLIQDLAREPRKSKGEKPASSEVMAGDGGTPLATGPPRGT